MRRRRTGSLTEPRDGVRVKWGGTGGTPTPPPQHSNESAMGSTKKIGRSISAFDLRALEGFHVEAARRLTGMRPSKRGDSWVYPKLADVLRVARLRTIGDYIARRRQTVLRAIADRLILEECMGAERRRGIPTRLYLWEQEFEEELSTKEEEEEEEED